jgi:hypothetical protein
VRVRPDPRSNASVSFGVGDVARGDLFHWLAQREAHGPRVGFDGAARKAAALVGEYWEDPLGDPLAEPPERPPVKQSATRSLSTT